MKHLDGPHSTSNCLLSTGGCLAPTGNSSEEINCITSTKTPSPNKATFRGSQWTRTLEGTLFNPRQVAYASFTPWAHFRASLQPLNARGLSRFPKLFHTVPDPGHPVLSGDWSVDSYLANILLNTLCFRRLRHWDLEGQAQPCPQGLHPCQARQAQSK